MIVKFVGNSSPVKWDTQKKQIYNCNSCGANLEEDVFSSFSEVYSICKREHSNYMNYYVKGSGGDPNSICVIHQHDCKCGEQFEVCFSSKFEPLGSFPNDEREFFISHVSGESLVRIDGLYSRIDCQSILEKYLMRWKYSSKMVFIVYPFVGNSWSNKDAEKTLDLWDDLLKVLSDERALIVTRSETVKILKEHLAGSIENFDSLNNAGRINPVVSNIKTKENFHAKFYAAIYGDSVEVLVGSHNIHGGEYIENFMFKTYSLKEFINLYTFNLGITPMLSDPNYQEKVLVIDCRKAPVASIESFRDNLLQALTKYDIS
ncbi:hypothetical protein GPK29_09395 [Aeromonas hydrophila]|uniref:hypothetical protein n=1 Tax=Aeromonas hydrophila TaxID=644 RepID=UPI001C5A9767|nr:hypothetical protein [Aeromonas hydrophila]MBW3795338.1 hypothetical protein [Aeromonas hydrophila]MBW3801270.1 hypothetical protein [Aeromonas hydrophila]MBW3817368.1 hypothetical protein [Aeromonas hydrophila]